MIFMEQRKFGNVLHDNYISEMDVFNRPVRFYVSSTNLIYLFSVSSLFILIDEINIQNIQTVIILLSFISKKKKRKLSGRR